MSMGNHHRSTSMEMKDNVYDNVIKRPGPSHDSKLKIGAVSCSDE